VAAESERLVAGWWQHGMRCKPVRNSIHSISSMLPSCWLVAGAAGVGHELSFQQGFFLLMVQVSGIRFTCDASRPPFKRVDAGSADCGQRAQPPGHEQKVFTGNKAVHG